MEAQLKRTLSALLLSFVLFAQILVSQTAPQPSSGSAATGSHATQQPKPNCTDNGTYQNSNGQTVKGPENCSAAPQGASAQCRDGTYSFSRSRRGTCSHHGGVAKWLCQLGARIPVRSEAEFQMEFQQWIAREMRSSASCYHSTR